MPDAEQIVRAIGVETSSRRGSVAIQWNRRVSVADLEGQRAHATDLLPQLDRLLREHRVDGVVPSARDASAIAVGIGPGSYTGTRIGIATALGLARASGARLIGAGYGKAWRWSR